MKKIHYITFIDTYSGIYQSQVIDVVRFLNANFDVEVQLFAFVPLRMWKEQKHKIKKNYPKAKVFPILGSLSKWKRNKLYFNFISDKQNCVCRGPMAFALAGEFYKNKIYDGRAAVEAEIKEYNVTGNPGLDKIFIKAENTAIKKADYYIAVSQKLVGFWEDKLQKTINPDRYSLIPCTLTSLADQSFPEQETDNTIRIVYAGGTGKWQSFDTVVDLMENVLQKQTNTEVVFLSKPNAQIKKLQDKFPGKCFQKWVNHNQVFEELSRCDYGILIREDKVTNRVASPVKFAEYLNAGLKVLITEHIGDFSEFTTKNNCGLIIKNEIPLPLEKVDTKEKYRLHQLSKTYFSKESPEIKKQYQKLVENCL